VRERGPFRAQGVHQLVKAVARASAEAEID
jgi:hypothetical protein